MARLFYTLLTFGVAFQLAAYIFWAFNVVPLVQYPFGDSTATMQNAFSITLFDGMFTALGAVGITIVGLLLRQGTYAIYALLIWVIGSLLPIVRTFFLTIPNTLGALIPNEVNPFYDPANPATIPLNPIIVAISVIFTYAAFWFLMELASQQRVTQ